MEEWEKEKRVYSIRLRGWVYYEKILVDINREEFEDSLKKTIGKLRD